MVRISSIRLASREGTGFNVQVFGAKIGYVFEFAGSYRSKQVLCKDRVYFSIRGKLLESMSQLAEKLYLLKIYSLRFHWVSELRKSYLP